MGNLSTQTIALHGRNVPMIRFASFQDAIRASESTYDVTHGGGASRKNSKREDWDLGWGFNKSLEFARAGWPEGLNQVARFADRLDVSGRIAKPEIVYDVTGNAGIDMGRVMQGEPECVMDWVDTDIPVDTQSPRGKICHIVFNFSASAGVDADILVRRGAACMAVIDALENAGRRVELTAHVTSPDYHIEIALKTPEYQPQEDQIAFALVAPAMLRRIGFSLMAQCGESGLACTRAEYGMPSNAPQGDIYFPSALYGDPQWRSDAAALTWIERILKEQGVELAPI